MFFISNLIPAINLNAGSGLAPTEADILGAVRRSGRLASGGIVAQERHWLLAPTAALAKIEAKGGTSYLSS